MSENLKDLKSPKQLARVLGVSDSTVRRWLRERKIRGCRVGERWRATVAAALAMVGEVPAEAQTT